MFIASAAHRTIKPARVKAWSAPAPPAAANTHLAHALPATR